MQESLERLPSTSLPRVVILGAGFGGLSAARLFRNRPVRVTIIDRNNHHLFQPLLYQVATAGLSPADITAPIRSLVSAYRNTQVLLGEVSAIDTAQQKVVMHDALGERSVPYDYLIVATGARHSYFGHPEWEPLAPGLKGVGDATAIRERVLSAFEIAELAQDGDEYSSWLTFVVVGAGPTGVELAGAFAELAKRALARDFRQINPRAARILLVEAGPRILPSFPEELATKAQKALQELGVEVLVKSPVEQIHPTHVVIAGKPVPARTVVWAAGVAASAAGKWLGAETDRVGRVKVNPDCSLPSHPEVFVVGDTAYLEQDGHALPGVAAVAMQQGRYVAKVILNSVKKGAQPEPFRYVDKGSLATVGRLYAIGTMDKLRFSGLIAWLVWAVVHIYYLINFRNRVIVLMQWFWAYLTYQRGARLIVSNRPLLPVEPVAPISAEAKALPPDGKGSRPQQPPSVPHVPSTV